MVIKLMNNTSETPKYEWKNNTSTILRGKGNNTIPKTLKERYLFIPMFGTFSIMNLSRADSGNFTLETFDSNGRKLEKRTLQLIVQGNCCSFSTETRFYTDKSPTKILVIFSSISHVQLKYNAVSFLGKNKIAFLSAPVSSVQLVTECLSEGQLKVSCLSEGGDSPQYNWSLNGHKLTDSELFSEYSETDVIVLRQNITGRLVCSVSNRFSSLSDEKTISTCGK